VKRLVNIYRMLRVSVPESELDAFRPGGGNEYQAAVLLLGILVGHPSVAQRVFASFMAAPDDADAWQLLRQFPEVYEQLSDLREYMCVGDAAAYRRWAPRVLRFSFRRAAVVPVDD